MDKFTNRALCANDKEPAEIVLSYWRSVRRCLVELNTVASGLTSLGFVDGVIRFDLFKAFQSLDLVETQLILLRRELLGEVSESEVL